MKKNILKSKTFWLNITGGAAFLIPVLPLDAETIGLILAGLNIINRKLTSSPITILPESEE
jgi:hypothetical protein